MEQYRPHLHFTPPSQWMNDPNGLVFDGERYHLYYQHNPFDRVWGPMYWGHATSENLLFWQHEPMAMAPDGLGDIFSGSGIRLFPGQNALLPAGGLAFLFTHHRHPVGLEQQSLATSENWGITLKKYAGNPVIPCGKPGDFRDPKVFWYAPEKVFVMIVAGGPVRIYRSGDLVHWELTQALDAIVTECPDLFPLDYEGKTYWVLSCAGKAYYLGQFDGRAFTPTDGPFPVDAGGSFYAAQSFDNTGDRHIWMGWMNLSSQAPTQPWRCSQSIPRECSLVSTPQGLRLAQTPIRELEDIRGLARNAAAEAGETVVTRVGSTYFDALWTADGEAELAVFRGKGGENRIRHQADGWHVLRTYSCPDFDSELILPDTGNALRILADESTLELFTSQGQALSAEIYAPEAGLPVELRCKSGSSHLEIHPLPQ